MKVLHFVKERIYVIGFVALFFVKYGYYGFGYYPILDDWIQYGTYPLADNIFETIIIGKNTITTRPLASLSDPYIWGQMWPHLSVAFFIITMMHLASCWFFYQVFKKNKLTIGYVALLIYGLFPFGTEATYWISASSRIIVGIFFLSVALYLLSVYFEDTSKKRFLIGFALVHLLSFCYYEPTIALGFFAAVLLLLNQRKNVKTVWIYSIPFNNLALIGGYYISFSRIGNMSERGQFIDENFVARWTRVINNVKYLWTEPQLQLYRNGIPRGFQVLLEQKSYLWLLLILGISILVGYLVFKETRYDKNGVKIALGILLMIIPYLPFFLLQEGGRELRVAFFSLLGLGILLQGIFDLVAFNSVIRAGMSFFVAVAVVCMLLVHVSELTDYKTVSDYDRRIGTDIINELEGTGVLEGTNQVVILNNKKSYATTNTDYFTHIANSTSSDWALTGLLRALTEDISLLYVFVARDNMRINYDESVMKEYVFLGIEEDGTVLTLQRNRVEKDTSDTVQKTVELRDEQGRLFGYIDLTNPEKMIFHKIEE